MNNAVLKRGVGASESRDDRVLKVSEPVALLAPGTAAVRATGIAMFPGMVYVSMEPHQDPRMSGLRTGAFFTPAGAEIPNCDFSKYTLPDRVFDTARDKEVVGFFKSTTEGRLSLRKLTAELKIAEKDIAIHQFHLGSVPGWRINGDGDMEMPSAEFEKFQNSGFEPAPEFYWDDKRKSLLIQSHDALGAIVPSKDGSYSFESIGDARLLDGRQMVTYPGLSELLSKQRARSPYQLVCDQGVLKISSSQDFKLLFTERVSCYSISGKSLYFAKPGDSTIYRAELDELDGISTPLQSTRFCSDGIVEAIALEPRGNFYVVSVRGNSKANDYTLCVVDAESGDLLHSIPNASNKFSVSADGSIGFIDANGQAMVAQSNFGTFKSGERALRGEERALQLARLSARLENLDLLSLPPATQFRPANEDQLRAAAQSRLESRFFPMIDKANSVEELHAIEETLVRLRNQEDCRGLGAIFFKVDKHLERKKDGYRIEGFKRSLDELSQGLPEFDTPFEAVRLRRELAKLEEARRNLTVMDSDLRAELEGRMKQLRTDVKGQIAKVGKASLRELEAGHQKLLESLSQAGSAPEVLLVSSSEETFLLKDLISLLPTAVETESWHEKVEGAIQSRRNEINREQEEHRAALRAESTLRVEEATELLNQVEELFNEAKARGELQFLAETNPLVKRFRESCADLTAKERKRLDDRFEVLMLARREALNKAKTPSKSAPTQEREVKFLKESFPVFQAPDLVWHPEVVPSGPDADQGALVFWSNFGQEYRPKIANVPIDLEDPLTVKAIEENKAKAAKFFARAKRQVPEINSKWAINDYHRQYLDEIAFVAKEQLENQRHILILEGEGGTGKNILLKMFANMTNRELFRFPCNAQMENQDLTASRQYSPEKGTYQQLAELIRKIQSPGTIVLLDELNALPTGTLKICNSLFDDDRCLIIDGKVYKVDKSVILAGAINPKGYAGTKAFSTEMKGRAHFITVNYPPEKMPDGRTCWYEAEMLAKQLPIFKGLTSDEFRALWEFSINGDKLSGGDAHSTPERLAALKSFKQIVTTATRLREAYAKYQLRMTHEAVNVPFSLRESTDTAARINNPRFRDVKDAIRSVFVSKGEDQAEKNNIEKIILSS